MRAKFKKGDLTQQQYESEIEKAAISAIRVQEEIGLDVLVHGEFERNDMVEYFGEQLDGFLFTKNGWVKNMVQAASEAREKVQHPALV